MVKIKTHNTHLQQIPRPSQAHHNPANIQVYVDGSHRLGKSVTGGIIVENDQIFISWNIFFGACPSVDYVETRAIYEGIVKCI